MKSLLIVLGITFTTLSFKPSDNYVNVSSSKVKETVLNCRFGQCQATAKSTGNRCKHCVSNSGDLYCWQHD